MMYISWTYKYVPLLVLNPDLFYPFGPIISFPTGIEGKPDDKPVVAGDHSLPVEHPLDIQ